MLISILRFILKESRALIPGLALVAFPAIVLFYYTNIHIELAGLHLQIKQLSHKQSDLKGKNMALRSAIVDFSRARLGERDQNDLDHSTENRVIRLKLQK